MTEAQLHAAEAFILKSRKNLEDKDSTIPREVWLVAAAMQEATEQAAQVADSWEATSRKLANEFKGSQRLYQNIAGDMASDIASAIRSPSSEPKRQP